MASSYFGKAFSDEEILRAIKENDLRYEKLSEEKIYEEVSDALINGKVIGWYQGRTEWGPRALGNRSILADPRDPNMKNKVNTIIKFREPYRPFAPSVLSEDVNNYIEQEKAIYPDRFMLVTYPVRKDKQKVIPAVTHINGSSRIQAVYKENNPRYWNLINKFKEKTGIGVVLNTSFNLKGEPIVNSPENAISTYLNSGIDLLVMGNFLIRKQRNG